MNSEEFYMEMLKEYVNGDKEAKLRQLFEEEDWENYRTIVHAMKSTSLTIGAAGVSEDAKGLEMAAKENRIEDIKMHHEEVMQRYHHLIGDLKVILE